MVNQAGSYLRTIYPEYSPHFYATFQSSRLNNLLIKKSLLSDSESIYPVSFLF